MHQLVMRSEKMVRWTGSFQEKLSNILGFDPFSLAKEGLWVSIAHGVALIFGLLLLLVFGRYASKETFGTFQLIMSFFGFFSLLSLPGLSTSLTRAIAQGNHGSYSVALKLGVRWSLLALPLFVLAALFYFLTKQTLVAIVLLVSSLFFVGLYALNRWTDYYLGKQEFRLLGLSNAAKSILVSIATILALLFFRDNVFLIILTYLVFTVGVNVFLSRKVSLERKGSSVDEEMVPYAKYLTKLNIFSSVVANLDKLVVGMYVGVAELAVYTIALEIALNFKELTKTLYKVVFPKFSNLQDVSRFLRWKFILKVFLLSCFAAALIILLIGPIMSMIFGGKYAESITLARLLLLAFPFWIINSFLMPIVENKKHKKSLFLITTIPYVMKALALIVYLFVNNLVVLAFGNIAFSIVITFVILSFAPRDLRRVAY